ncbi:MAG: Rrf2 family transcriptional regulator [Phycisphaerales bacterium]|nr:Rrf2 family transcriptional regulator [Phycisphaerales bacterium]
MSQSYEHPYLREAAEFFREKAGEMQESMNEKKEMLSKKETLTLMNGLRELKKKFARNLGFAVSELRRIVSDKAVYDKALRELLWWNHPLRSPDDDALRQAITDPDGIPSRWPTWEIGYNDFLFDAGRYVLRASRHYGVWKALTDDFPSETPCDDADDNACRAYWEETVLPQSKRRFKQDFTSKDSPEADLWRCVIDRIDAFKLWAKLIEDHINATPPATDGGEKPVSSEPTPVTTKPEQGNASGDQDAAINERQQKILIAMFELKAFDSDSRCSTEKIAKHTDKFATPKSYKQPMADLGRHGLVNKKRGSGGGCWLSEKGQERAEQLKGKV